MSRFRIPFNRPTMIGNELDYIRHAYAQGHLSGDGDFTKRCSALLRQETGAAKVLLTTSCTHALEMSALLLDLEPGDEVIVPSYAFVTTAGAFSLHGATPVFVDVRSDTLNLDERLLADAITPRTKAIVPLHYAGVSCEMDSILDLAQARGVAVVEDNAHGLFGRYKGRSLGTMGALGTQSFHETKNITCGEGGALLINEERLVHRAEIIREKGTNRSAFFRGQVDKYTWVDAGSSYLPSEVLAAFLFAQLEEWDAIQAKRRQLWDRYAASLTDWAAGSGVTLPTVPESCEQAYHMFYMLMPSLESRTAFIDALKARGILSVFHYLPLHLSDMGRSFGGKPGDCPVSEDVADRLVRLPFYNELSELQQDDVIAAVQAFQPLEAGRAA